MGLDQYIHKTAKVDTEEDKYWRKNNQLQGWFEENYNVENCQDLPLTTEMVTELLEDIDKGLAQTSGFFYGNSAMNEKEIKELKSYFKGVLANLDEYNYTYYCWY